MEGICWKKVFLSLSCCGFSFSMWLYWSNNPYCLTNSFLKLAKNKLFNRCEGRINKTHPLQSNRQDCDSYFAHRPLSLIFVYWREQFTHWVFTKLIEQLSLKTYIIHANNPDLGEFGQAPEDGEGQHCHAAVRGITKNQTQVSDWTPPPPTYWLWNLGHITSPGLHFPICKIGLGIESISKYCED